MQIAGQRWGDTVEYACSTMTVGGTDPKIRSFEAVKIALKDTLLVAKL